MKKSELRKIIREEIQRLTEASWKDKYSDKQLETQLPVQVVSTKGATEFKNLVQARKKFPTLDPKKNTKDFTWAMRGEIKGKPALRFETWKAYKIYST